MGRALRAYPITLTLVAVLAGAALWTRSHLGPLPPDTRERVGLAPLHLLHGDWPRLLISVFVTAGGARFYGSLALLALAVGAAERAYGSARALAAFWIGHVGTVLLLTLVLALPLRWLAVERAELVLGASDVGPSAGAYACLGAACAALSPRARRLAAALGLAILLARLAVSLTTVPDEGRAISADLAHALAFPLGLGMAGRLRRIREGAGRTAPRTP